MENSTKSMSWSRGAVLSPEEDRQRFEEQIREINTLVTDNPEAARQLLIETGIITEDGQLCEQYRDR